MSDDRVGRERRGRLYYATVVSPPGALPISFRVGAGGFVEAFDAESGRPLANVFASSVETQLNDIAKLHIALCPVAPPKEQPKEEGAVDSPEETPNG